MSLVLGFGAAATLPPAEHRRARAVVPRAGALVLAGGIVGLIACRTPASDREPSAEVQPEVLASGAHAGAADTPSPEAPSGGEEPRMAESTPPPLAAEPNARPHVATLRASAGIVVFDAPTREARKMKHYRGTIPKGAVFRVEAFVEGTGCKAPGWVQVAPNAFGCATATTETTKTPVSLADLRRDGDLPFFYAKPRHKDGEGAPRWPSQRAAQRDEPTTDRLPTTGSFAFKRATGRNPNSIWVDSSGRAVRLSALRPFKASKFAGRDVEREPVASDTRGIAWTVVLHPEVRASPAEKAAVLGELVYHQQIDWLSATAECTDDDCEADDGRSGWVEVRGVDRKGRALVGWLPATQVRRWQAPPPLDGVKPNETWIDVDLRQQVLTLMRGSTPVLATLVSTGKPGDATPTGIFRIRMKKAWSKMQSEDGAADTYYVEAVPWTQFFQAGYALHASYWHDNFGRRTSHGCINLAPADAKRVFFATGPALPDGWLTITEDATLSGSTLRVRKGNEPVEDRRGALGGDFEEFAEDNAADAELAELGAP